MKLLCCVFFLPLQIFAQTFTAAEIKNWDQQAKQIEIFRDAYGIPHVYGKTDADAVFGLLYAQCEDDFNRIELNYIEKLGRLSEINGKQDLYNDLLIKLVIDSADAIKDYEAAPKWLKEILNAFADGVNFYLYKHPQVKPLLLQRFEPWYALLWTDGSIGAISTAGISVNEIKNFYSGKPAVVEAASPFKEEVPTGSNGFAFSPKITTGGKAILYINPHVTFYFRPEVHMVSNQGLNAYGAVTWGQPFIYQGFNEKCGWMHTSSKADISDAYIEKISKQNGKWFYEYEGKQLPVTQKIITVKYKSGNALISEDFIARFTHHGPILTKRNGQYLSLKHNNRDAKGFMQSWLRTKAKNFAEFKTTMNMVANPSNNTVYADAEGNIAYWHGNFLPKRDVKYNWEEPVDGSIAATEWQGFHTVAESVHIYNPENGWLQNCNATPFTAAGKYSPQKENYAAYLAPDGENFRGINAVRVLKEETKYDLDKVIAAGYDTRLAAFEVLVPALIKSYETQILNNDMVNANLREAIDIFKNWDYRSGENSVATTLAVLWGEKLLRKINGISPVDDQVEKTKIFAAKASAGELVMPLQEVINELQTNFGNWQMPWGQINRFQRIANDLTNKFDDAQSSYPVGFVSSTWGMLPSYSSRTFSGTKKRYGVNGNSFIAAVEFGKKVKAKSLLAGGVSGDPNSKHFFDQGEMYSKGKFKEVLFYKKDVKKNSERKYHPGE